MIIMTNTGIYVHAYSFWTTGLSFLKLANFGSARDHTHAGMFLPLDLLLEYWLDRTYYHRAPLCQIYILN